MKTFVMALAVLGMAEVASAQCSAPYFVEQRFPTTGTEETRWRICWQNQGKHGLVITAAFFRKSPSAPFVRVFWDARLAEIFVPYHAGQPRFLDLSDYSGGLVTLNQAHCPAATGGTLLGSPAVVCKELHDRGLAWMDDGKARRGEEVVLWGTIDAANYNNVVSFAFRDDGAVEGKYGATAVNLSLDPDMVHMHSPIWRLDIDLDGFQGDTVHVASHLETGLPATDTSVPVNIEGAIDWKADQFTMLHIHDGTLKNGKGQSSMLHFMPLRWGQPKHQEPFVNRDFWVTRYNGTEMWAKDLPAYAANAQNVANNDVVVWYMGAVHHAPRAEDGELVNGRIEGAAQVMWTGWLLKPHNLFDRTPLYPRQ